MSDEKKVEEAASALEIETLGNTKRKKYNKLAVKDLLIYGNRELRKNIVKIQRKAKARDHRKLQLIHMAAKYFRTHMTYRQVILKDHIEESQSGEFNFVEQDWEISYRSIMAKRRADGKTSVHN